MYWLILSIAVFGLLYYLSTRRYNYWTAKNVPHPKPIPLFGNYREAILLQKNLGEMVQDICNKFPDEPYIGAYIGTKPVFIPKDPEFIKLVVTKDFPYFNGRELSDYVHKDLASLNLFSNYGDNWKILRQNMTPLFSSAKMKNMFQLIQKCTFSFEKLLDKELSMSQKHEIDVKDLMERFTIECIGACVFGVQTQTIRESSKNNPFRKAKNDFKLDSRKLALKRIFRAIWPDFFYALGLKLITTELDTFTDVVKTVFQNRNYKSSSKHDFVDLILGWRENSFIVGDSMKNMKSGTNDKVQLKVDDDLLIAQCLVFFAAGFETSATTSMFTLYELAKNEKALEKVLEEVDAYLAKHNNNINYECVHELPYLDACIDETLRLYPVLGMITRELMEDYKLPNGTKLEKGLIVHLPVQYIQNNPKIWPQPEVYRPERFYEEEKHKVQTCSYMPFGEGPRVCIGKRFAKMQMLTGLITIFKKYRITLGNEAPTKIEFNTATFTTSPKQNIFLKFVERDGWEQRTYARIEN
ncbi:hypothetical protein K1T71_009492 [Dendrolimus kikuchii]|uniref:Uncharacterized protein n=1 Tax=Dendrolimus kikuchii TaxID=765133 RepID=A0ACC1CUK5_9NEOP|nr:hypothetical protein K1T71_009492 [Dendrolimus kikuchii]